MSDSVSVASKILHVCESDVYASNHILGNKRHIIGKHDITYEDISNGSCQCPENQCVFHCVQDTHNDHLLTPVSP